jgi:hypothetical protein
VTVPVETPERLRKEKLFPVRQRAAGVSADITGRGLTTTGIGVLVRWQMPSVTFNRYVPAWRAMMRLSVAPAIGAPSNSHW